MAKSALSAEVPADANARTSFCWVLCILLSQRLLALSLLLYEQLTAVSLHRMPA